MSNIFVNRNRSQGAYGVPVNTQKFKDVNDTWQSRSKNDQFYQNSLKYGSNPDLQPTKVKFQWLLDDTQDLVKKENASIPRKENEGNWKFFNSFEKQDYQQKTREILKDEINNIALRIAKAREVQSQIGSWRVPEVEPNARNFDEGSRFFRNSCLTKLHGLKYVPPPKAEHLQQLRDENKFYQMANPDYLKNEKYQRPKTAIKRGEDWISLLSTTNEPTFKKRKNAVTEKKSPEREEMRTSQSKLLRNLDKTTVHFPQRFRFNEEANYEIKSQKSTTKKLNKKFLIKNLDGEIPSQKGDFSQKTAVSSNKTVTGSQLSNFFKKKSQSVVPIPKKVKKAKSLRKNGRYAASKAGSVMGFLLVGKPKAPATFETMSEVESNEPYIRPQDKFYVETQNDVETQQTIDEITFLDETSILPDAEAVIENPAGHQYATWGTAYQNFQAPVKPTDHDALTSISDVPSSQISQNLRRLEDAVHEQIIQRLKMQRQISDLKMSRAKAEKEEKEFLISDKAFKLNRIAQRDLLVTGQNYMRHPQIEDL